MARLFHTEPISLTAHYDGSLAIRLQRKCGIPNLGAQALLGDPRHSRQAIIPVPGQPIFIDLPQHEAKSLAIVPICPLLADLAPGHPPATAIAGAHQPSKPAGRPLPVNPAVDMVIQREFAPERRRKINPLSGYGALQRIASQSLIGARQNRTVQKNSAGQSQNHCQQTRHVFPFQRNPQDILRPEETFGAIKDPRAAIVLTSYLPDPRQTEEPAGRTSAEGWPSGLRQRS